MKIPTETIFAISFLCCGGFLHGHHDFVEAKETAESKVEEYSSDIFRIKRSSQPGRAPQKQFQAPKPGSAEDDDPDSSEKEAASSMIARGDPFGDIWNLLNATDGDVSEVEVQAFAKYCRLVNLSDPENVTLLMPPCASESDKFCHMSDDYPIDFVNYVVSKHRQHVEKLYKRLPSSYLTLEDMNARWTSGTCESSIENIRMSWGQDIVYKEWMIIINTDEFPQEITVESCSVGISNCSAPSPYEYSTCEESHRMHSLLTVTPCKYNRFPALSIFRFPTSCSCKVHRDEYIQKTDD